MAWFKRGPKLGTPENPEIILPGEKPRERGSSRWLAVVGVLRWTISISLPALFADFACYGLLQMGRQPGGALAWVLLALISIPAAVLTLVALFTLLILFLTLMFALFGRQIQFSRVTFRR